MAAPTPRTMYEKIWDEHAVRTRGENEALLYVDYNVVHEGPFYAFDGLIQEGRAVRRPAQTIAFSDHYVPTVQRERGLDGIVDPEARSMVEQLAKNAATTGITHYGMDHPQQGIMHVVAAELGLVQPGMVVTGSDSHIATNGAFGAFGFGVGASQVKHILATQTVWLKKARTMQVVVDGTLGPGVSAKDVVLAIIEHLSIGGGVGHVIEYTGTVIRALSMEGRMTLCNMTIEGGARAGMIAPDEITVAYLKGREYAPDAAAWADAVAYWRSIATDAGATYDRHAAVDGSRIEPMVTWGTAQDEATGIGGTVPDPESLSDPARRVRARRALDYMKLVPGQSIRDIAIDRVFIGSCTNARLEDLREAARVAEGRKVVVPSVIVPGSQTVKRAAEAEGLDQVFLAAGFEWRSPGCSMCTGSNGDRVPAGERCASTSNRNFEGRQGRGSLTHLVSPAMAAAAAISGRLADVRDFL
ncbi:MAG: 3-isopropylmalate dehydratase large subunit [Betaproteobacteria bacterium]|nr:3-isopropylmalate dehydratase large subunit [Betaproteobacteria bacterium]